MIPWHGGKEEEKKGEIQSENMYAAPLLKSVTGYQFLPATKRHFFTPKR